MHPAIAGLIGAGLALTGSLFAYLLVRGRHDWRRLEARRLADKASAEVRAVLGQLRSGAVLVGPHDEILSVNERAMALGLVRGTRIGCAELLDKVRQVRGAHSAYRGEVARQATPERAELATVVAPMPDDNVLVLADDLTAQRRAEAVRRDFVANVSHELKTPIGAIGVLAEAVEAAKDEPAEVERFAGRLRAETSRLAGLVARIIDLSRLEAADPQAQRDVVNISSVIEEATARTREAAEARAVTLVAVPGPEAWVVGDRRQLVDAVANLAHNAITYSGAHARVSLSVTTTGGQGAGVVEIKVADNGIGIKPEEQERIFERFYRVDYARTRSSGGTGLGLSIVRHIAMAHGGSVRVWSVFGQGSTFTLCIPAHEPEG